MQSIPNISDTSDQSSDQKCFTNCDLLHCSQLQSLSLQITASHESIDFEFSPTSKTFEESTRKQSEVKRLCPETNMKLLCPSGSLTKKICNVVGNDKELLADKRTSWKYLEYN